MRITAIGCLHGYYPQLDGGDLLIVTGDLTAKNLMPEYSKFFSWISKQKYKKAIYIAGNHDGWIQKSINSREKNEAYPGFLRENCELECLSDSGTEFEGLNIWGSPWSLTFDEINPKCGAFTGKEKDLQKKWDMIPEDTDILITHTPPNGILDAVQDSHRGKILNCGSVGLRNMILDRKRLPNLKLHVFSHIHEWGGKDLNLTDLKLVNCSIMNEHYKSVYKPFTFELS